MLFPLAFKRVHRSHRLHPRKSLYCLPSNACISGITGTLGIACTARLQNRAQLASSGLLEMPLPLTFKSVHRSQRRHPRNCLYRSPSKARTARIADTFGNACTARLKHLHRTHRRHPRKCKYRPPFKACCVIVATLGSTCTACLQTWAPLESSAPLEMIVPLAFKCMNHWHHRHPGKCLDRSPSKACTSSIVCTLEMLAPLAFKSVRRSHRPHPWKYLYCSPSNACTARIVGKYSVLLVQLALKRVHCSNRRQPCKCKYRSPSNACTDRILGTLGIRVPPAFKRRHCSNRQHP